MEFINVTPKEDSVLNTMQVIKAIDKNTVHRICSGQVIISLAIALKELIENSIDAGATNIDVRLVEYGSELIEVHDNGSGVDENNFKALAMKHYTSKLEDYSQLEKIATLGFRGEALSSLCALCNLTIITRHSTAEYATKIEYDNSGNVFKTTPSARSVGTTVTLANLFSTLPVRKMEFSKNLKREYSKMYQLLTAYCIVSAGIKFTCNNKCGILANKLILSTPGSGTIKQNIVCIFDAKLLSTLVEVDPVPPTKAIAEEYGIEVNDNEPLVFHFDCLISSAMHGLYKTSSNKQYIYINNRPCDFPKVIKLVNEVYRSYNNTQYPFIYLNIKATSTIVDVNVTPDKRQVFLEKEKLLLATLKTSLHNTMKNFPSTFKCQNLDISQRQDREIKSSEIGMESSNQHVRGIKRFLTDYDRKSPRKKSDIKRSKSDFFKIHEKRLSQDALTSEEKPENVTSTQLLDSFIEHAQKFISDETVETLILEDENVVKKDLANFGISAKRSCTNKARKETKDMVTISDESDETDSHGFNKNIDASNKLKSCVLRKLGAKFNDVVNNTSITTADETVNGEQSEKESNASKSIADVLEESGVEIVELTQSKKYEEISKYRKKIPLKISLQSIREKLDQMGDASKNSRDIQINFRSNINPKCNSDAEQELQRHITKGDFSEMEIIGQFNLAFMVVKLKHDLFIIDQHACDEKYNFEQLQRSTVIESQNMVRPLLLELSAANEELIIEYEKIFNKNGFFFIIYKDGEPTKRIKLTRVPLSKDYSFGKDDIDEMLCLLQEDDSTANILRPSRIRLMFASRACRKSVMIGRTLNVTEMRKLVNHMGEIDEPWNCPHGRPTMRHLVHLQLLKK